MPIVVPGTTVRTLGQLKARIADELARTDLADQIALAIDDAVSEAAANRFWFNEVLGLTFSTVIGQAYYTSDDIAALTEIDALYITVNGQRRDLRAASQDELNSFATGTPPTGEPFAYSRYADQLRLDPLPRLIYPVFIDGLSQLPALADDTGFNAWTDTAKGERLIRALAKRNILADVVMDLERADLQAKMAEKYRQDLLAQTGDRISTNRMAAYG